jgi:hypothetical protein
MMPLVEEDLGGERGRLKEGGEISWRNKDGI